MNIVVLCGGVGGSKFAIGVQEGFPDDDITLIVNTSDDVTQYGLHVSPDLDTVMYTLAGLSDPVRGWGLEGETFRALDMLKRYGNETWFGLGDADLGTHLARTELLAGGLTLTAVTERLRTALGVRTRLLPMTNDRVQTRIEVKDGWIPFQEYFVKRRYADLPLAVEYQGSAEAGVTAEARSALAKADVIAVAPSNPVVSIGPILSIAGLRSAIRESTALRVAVSPFIGARSVTGPADALMSTTGRQPTAVGLAELYGEWLGRLDALVFSDSDGALTTAIESLGTQPVMTDTLMPDLPNKMRLARFAVEAVL